MWYFKLVFKSAQNFEELPDWAERLEHKKVFTERYSVRTDRSSIDTTWKVKTFQTAFFENESEMLEEIACLTRYEASEYEDPFDMPEIIWSGKCLIPETVEAFAADRRRACRACGEFGFENRRRIRKEAREEVKTFARTKQEERDFIAFLNWYWSF